LCNPPKAQPHAIPPHTTPLHPTQSHPTCTTPPSPLCLPDSYIWLRFGSPRGQYLATQQGLARPVFLQSTWLRSREAFDAPMRFGYVQVRRGGLAWQQVAPIPQPAPVR
jgi:hypothetical protein